MKITAWKCEQTNKIFEVQSDYVNHKARLRRQLKKRQVIDLQYEKTESFFYYIGQVVSNLDELVEIISRNWVWFTANYKLHTSAKKSAKYPNLNSISFNNIRWRPERQEWCGYILLELDHSAPSFGSMYFDNSIIHTGSGGGNSKQFYWSVALGATDFPKMNISRERAEVWNIISNSNEIAFL